MTDARLSPAHDNVVLGPLALEANLPERFYRGGAAIAAFRGSEQVGRVHAPRTGSLPPPRSSASTRPGSPASPTGGSCGTPSCRSPSAGSARRISRRYGASPALLVKLLDAGQRLPVHAHPSREWARRHLDCPYGKTEAWVIVECEPDSLVHLGFRRDVEAEELAGWVERQDEDALIGALHALPVQRGDSVLVPAGMPHAIGAGIFLVELQEPTDLSVLMEWKGFELDGPKDGHLGLGFDVALSCVDRAGHGAERLRELHSAGSPPRCEQRPPAAERALLPRRAAPAGPRRRARSVLRGARGARGRGRAAELGRHPPRSPRHDRARPPRGRHVRAARRARGAPLPAPGPEERSVVSLDPDLQVASEELPQWRLVLLALSRVWIALFLLVIVGYFSIADARATPSSSRQLQDDRARHLRGDPARDRPDVRDRDRGHRPLDRRDPGLLGRLPAAQVMLHLSGTKAQTDDGCTRTPAGRSRSASWSACSPGSAGALFNGVIDHASSSCRRSSSRSARSASPSARRPARGRHQPLAPCPTASRTTRQRQVLGHLRARADRGDRRAARPAHVRFTPLRPLHAGGRLERGGGAPRRASRPTAT